MWIEHGGTSKSELLLKRAEGKLVYNKHYSDLIRWNDMSGLNLGPSREKREEVAAAFENVFELKPGSLKIRHYLDRGVNMVEGSVGERMVFSYQSYPRVR